MEGQCGAPRWSVALKGTTGYTAAAGRIQVRRAAWSSDARLYLPRVGPADSRAATGPGAEQARSQGSMNLSDIDWGVILIQYVCLLFSLCVHEAAHGAMADRLGDPSARLLGRVTLNPLPHIDPVGTVVMPLAMMVSSSMGVGIPLIGWAKPVPYNPRNLHHPRRDPMLVALAGPLSNLVVAVAGVAVAFAYSRLAGHLPGQFASVQDTLLMVLMSLIIVNVALMLFNLIPLPPLDGHHVLEYFLPPGGQRVLDAIAPYSIFLIIFLAPALLRVPLGAILRLVVAVVQ